MTHSLAPWRIEYGHDAESKHDYPHWWSVWGADGRFVAKFEALIPEAQEIQRADIALIRAAPELLDELKSIAFASEAVARLATCAEPDVLLGIAKRARIAIGKATP